MKGIHIIATGRALPKNILDNDALSRMVETNDEWIRTRTGIGQRHICEEETCVSLAVDAAKKAVEKAAMKQTFNKEEIGAVVVATVTPDYVFPSVACMIQKELGLSEDIIAFDISAACSGFLYGLEICRNLLITQEKKYALLIGSEQMSKLVDYSDRSSCILFGDGAGAALIEARDSLYVQKNWSRGDTEALFCKDHIQMNGNKVFRFAVSVLKDSMGKVLEKANLTMEDIDCVVCHQANARIIEHVRQKYPGHQHKFYMNIERYGNTSAASVPIALDELLEAGILKEGMKVICTGFGAGFTWSCALFEV